eukprot:TRINITY_DN36279_c1_g1_i1.p1 TRINITY_DN36279_c1_g1~~TRINITY_DN36279_c1_g1_i1.p1  ORF type:complete len:162 (+),score=4.79 TRINITY_DN36279_c1_g1_i1:252-737(+)
MLCCSLDHRLLSSSLSSPKSRSSHSVIPCLCLLNTKLSCFRFSHISFCVDILVILTMKPIISCLPCNLLYHSNSVNLSPCRCHVMEASCIAIPTLTNRPSTFVSTDPFFQLITEHIFQLLPFGRQLCIFTSIFLLFVSTVLIFPTLGPTFHLLLFVHQAAS